MLEAEAKFWEHNQCSYNIFMEELTSVNLFTRDFLVNFELSFCAGYYYLIIIRRGGYNYLQAAPLAANAQLFSAHPRKSLPEDSVW